MEEATLRLPPPAARRLVLVQAIDQSDPDGKLLSDVEREQLEQLAAQAVRGEEDSGRLDRGRYLQERARRILAAVQNRQPRIAALQEGEGWQATLTWALPLAACLLGAAIDRIDNPRQVNMLSPPLLAVLLWNLLAYAALLAALVLRRAEGWGPLAALQRRLAGAQPSAAGPALRANVTAAFRRLWFSHTAPAQALWWRQLLHATAAAWAVGLAISIVLGGLVREYRVGWESTLLELPQVHAFLSALFAPVVALLPFDGFTLAELQRMHFRSGADIGAGEARRWIWLYLALLCLVVVVPRLALAAWAWARRKVQGRTVCIDLRERYYADVLARVSPARVVLGLLARDAAARELLLRVLGQAADAPAAQAGQLRRGWTVLTTPREDELRLVELAAEAPPPPPAAMDAPAVPWMQHVLGRWRAPPPVRAPGGGPRAEADLVLLLPAQPGDVEALAPALGGWGAPVLILVRGEEGPWREAAGALDVPADVLALERATRHWRAEAALRSAIGARLPPAKAAGFARIAAAWADRHELRFAESMRLLATQLLQAARETEEVPGGPLSFKRLLKPGEREADQQARQAAMAAVVERLREGETATLARLLALHAIAEPVGARLQQRLHDEFVLQQPVDSPQAGMAGAASGAALGAGIDLMTGGMTLGAAAALGALIGGTAAFSAAYWKNRNAPSGATQVQVSDEMLQNLAEAALLHYLAVIHWGRGAQPEGPAPQPSWQSEVVAAVEAERAALQAVWAQGRTEGADGPALTQRLARLLQAICGRVLARLPS